MINKKRFAKMHGTGNDFIIVEPSFFGLNNERQKLNTFTEEQKGIIVPQVIELCHQRFSIGANGVLVVSQVGQELYKMSVFNSDGCMGANCGNGLRCVALYLHKKRGFGPSFPISTDSGDKQAEITITQNKQYYVKINLGSPSPIAEVSFNLKHNQKVDNYLANSSIYSGQIGNHHLVIFLEQKQFQSIVKDNAFALIAEELVGKDLINVNFCCVQSSKDLRIVTCQFGAGVTLACGTGSSVSAYVGFSTGRLQSEVNVHTRGGTLIITTEKEQKVEIFLNGPAKLVYFGQMEE